jgi:hypothetical protein
LRGEEISKNELTGIVKDFEEWGTAQQKYVTLSLVRIFKEVEGEQQAVTVSGLRIREWVGHLLAEKKAAGITTGLIFRRKGGKLAKADYLEEPLIERLERIQQTQKVLSTKR